MAESLTSEQVLSALHIQNTEATAHEFQISGTVPSSIASTEIKRTLTVLGITPADFSAKYSTTEFNFTELSQIFSKYCKDYPDELRDNVPSKALEFAAKVLFEYGPYIRIERKSKGDKAIRVRFPYKKTTDGTSTLSLKTVIVTTFKELTFEKQVEDDKLILTFRQAALLAMTTFSKAIEYCYNKNSTRLMTPLCGAIFSRDAIQHMALELGVEESAALVIINESAASGGQYLKNSDIACAIVCMITATKKVSDKNIRDSMISKVVKQYIHKGKEYSEARFTVFAKYALGGVPLGLDSATLISVYTNIQAQSSSLRARAIAVKQSATTYDAAIPVMSTSSQLPERSISPEKKSSRK